MELSFDNVNSGGVTDMAGLRVAQLLSNIWTDEGNTATTGTAGSSGSVTSVPLTVFDPTINYFTLASSDASQNPLPVTLISFNGELYHNSIVLTWQVAGSWQAAYFELQSSEDGDHFVFVSRIDTIISQALYRYRDNKIFSGKQHYRLKIIEKDGSFFYSNSIQADISTNTFKTVLLSPSPVKTNALLLITAATSMQVQLSIFNTEGKMIVSENAFLQTGNNHIPLQLQQLAAGIYTLTVRSGDNKINTCRFIKAN